jgi:hypothetical protein
MITIFTCPKSFNKKTRIIQTNAINSWKNLDPKIQIILVGNDKTTKEFSRKNKTDLITNVRLNKYGTPYVNSIFELAEKESRFNTLVYINSDIILFGDFLRSAKAIGKLFKRFLIVGQRHDLQVNQLINFANLDEVSKLNKTVHTKGKKHGHTGMDYFIYNKGSLGKIPPFLIGRDSWDNWMIYNARERGLKVIEATKIITSLHQNHDYTHLNKSRKYEEEMVNDLLAKGKTATMNDVDFRMNEDYKLIRISSVERAIKKRVNDFKFLLSDFLTNTLFLGLLTQTKPIKRQDDKTKQHAA